MAPGVTKEVTDMERKLIGRAQQFACAFGAPETKRAAETKIDATAGGTFKGYASLFNIRDLGNDIVMPGAFGASLRNRGERGVKLLWQHDATQPVGAWLSLHEDDRGLRVHGRLNLNVAKAREILSLMQEGAVDGLSIGFRTQKASRDRKSGTRRLYQLDLWEISLVTFPMLPQARVEAVKRGTCHSDGMTGGTGPAMLARSLRRAASTLR
jgi:HK97 family phage prohead protease